MFVSQLRVTGLNSLSSVKPFSHSSIHEERHTLMGSQQYSLWGPSLVITPREIGNLSVYLEDKNVIVASFPARNDMLESVWGWGQAVPHCESVVMCICLPICKPRHMWYFAYIIINNTISKENLSEHLQYPDLEQLLGFMTDRDPSYGCLWYTLYSCQDYVLRLLDI